MPPTTPTLAPAPTTVDIPPQSSPMIRPHSWAKRWLILQMGIEMYKSAFRNTRSLGGSIRLIRDLLRKTQHIADTPSFAKVARVSGRYFWRMALPGYPSPAIGMMLDNEMNRLSPVKPTHGLRSLLIAITKKCPLKCEHCFEWDNLNQPETLSTHDLIQLVRSYQAFGTNQIILGGGEPMVRIKDIYQILASVGPESDLWIYTSGFGFSAKHARQLKKQGLTGVIVSLDHHTAAGHDRFRGYPGAFEAATQACIQAKAAGLVVALSICVTPTNVHKEELEAYLELARRLGVCFVQYVEARPAGRYRNQAVALTPEQLAILREIHDRYNADPRFWDYPLITWPDQQRRNVGCLAGGRGFFYIDTDGDAHACPFCAGKVCSTIGREAADVIADLQQGGCHLTNWSKV